MNITGNSIFIPGATSGIGLALALRLKAAGNTVIVGGRRVDVLEGLAAQYGFETVAIDVTDPASVLAARDRVLSQRPDLNVVVAMAGVMLSEDVRRADFLADAERIVETNILGPLRLVAAFVEHLQTRPDSTLITVSSGLAHVPLAITPTYNGSKAFIHRFSETIRLQLARTSVKVVEIVPPGVRTELMPGQSEVDRFMTLDAFADEVMALLESQPDASEILVEDVRFLRLAEVEGRYAQTVALLNSSAQ
jgi:short-subunit dehydrogenase involved in D-alanine esterification of teichoic acids